MDCTNYEELDNFAKDIHLKREVNILYLGDSLTFFDKGNNHADKVIYFLNKYNPGKAFLWNYAAGGEDIERIIHRFNGRGEGKYKDIYHDLWNRNYDWVFVFLGHNDTKASSINSYTQPVIPPDKQRVLYEKLIATLQNKGVQRIIFISPTSSNYELCEANSNKAEGVHNRFGDPKHLEVFAAVLKELVQKHHLEYVDIYAPMKELSSKNELVNAVDGVHLTAKGHDFVARETLRYLKNHQD